MLFIRKFNEITEKFAVQSHSKRERKILVSTGCHSKECPPPRFVINIATTAGFWKQNFGEAIMLTLLHKCTKFAENMSLFTVLVPVQVTADF